ASHSTLAARGTALIDRRPGDWRKTRRVVHPQEGRMGRTAAAVVLALSSSILTLRCSKDPSPPPHREAQLDQAQRPSEKVRVLENLRASKKLDKAFVPMLNARMASEKSPETKAVIARALGELRDPSSVDPLAKALEVNTADGATSRM